MTAMLEDPMRRPSNFPVLVLVLVLMAALAVGFSAEAAKSAEAQTLDRILPAVERQVPGTMLDAAGSAQPSDHRKYYRIKWLTPDGRVIWLRADVNSGKIE